MGIIDKINGYNRQIKKAEYLYNHGEYKEAIMVLDVSQIQACMISKEQFCISELIAAKCFKELGNKDAAIDCLNRIIDYPGYNNKYISEAEALKRQF